MKCTIFYFSGTGNTKWVVRKTTKLLKSKGYDAHNYSIEKLAENQTETITNAVQNSDYIGFAYPIYGADTPRIMREFFDEFIKHSKPYINSKAKLFFINTFGYINGQGYFRIKKLFKKCELPIIGYVNFHLVNNTFKYKDTPPLLGSNMPKPTKEKAMFQITKLVKTIETNKKIFQGIGPHLLIGIIIRNALKDKIKNSYQTMSVDYTKCIKCMKCVKVCPTQSIEFVRDNFVFTESCESCWRCRVSCPTGAIFTDKNPIPRA